MRCPRCETDNREGRRFCSKCGALLAVACTACGFANEPGENFCGGCGVALATSKVPPASYTPGHLAEKILTSKAALEGERKQVTVLFADLKGSMELLADRDPEEARKITHSHRLQGWMVLEAASVSYGTATSYLPLIDLLKSYFQIFDRDEPRTIREKVTGKLLALDRALEPTLSPLLALLESDVRRAEVGGSDARRHEHLRIEAAIYREMGMRYWLERVEAGIQGASGEKRDRRSKN